MLRVALAILFVAACHGDNPPQPRRDPQGMPDPRPAPAPPADPNALPPLTSFDHQPFTGSHPDQGGQFVDFIVDDPSVCEYRRVEVDSTGKETLEPCTPTRQPRLAGWRDDARVLHEPNEVVAPATLRVVFDYPLARAVSFDLHAAAPDGFRRRELLTRVGEIYEYIYREERRTQPAPQQVVTRGGNISKTAGAFGIWGHELHDLVFVGIRLVRDPTNLTIGWLHVES
jgi:hypothetical protein